MDFKKSVVGLRDKFATILFSVGLSAVIILGKHIHLTDRVYQGTGTQLIVIIDMIWQKDYYLHVVFTLVSYCVNE